MAEYLAPGVYVEEIDTGSKPIEGVSTSTAGMIGVTERGPVNVPILITGTGDFTRWFGEKLQRELFSNGSDPHWLLPHAIEGFFTNGGKRVYVTRVLDTATAQNAAIVLHDRGTATSGATVLLRRAPENTGTAVSPPLLTVLDGANLSPGDTIRIGDGSDAEYRQIVGPLAAEDVLVPLSMPLSRSHAVAGTTVEQFTPALPVATFALHDPAAAGDPSITIDGAAADFAGLVVDELLEIGAVTGIAEHRFVRQITMLSATRARVRLDSAIAMPYVGATPVHQLALGVGPPTAILSPSAHAGDGMLFVDSRGGDFDVRTDLVVVDSGNTATREVRRIGELHAMTTSSPSPDALPAGSLVQGVALGDNAATTVAGPGVGAVIPVADVSNLAVGQTVLIGLLPGFMETAVIQTIQPGALPNPTITLSAALVTPALGGELVVATRRLTANVQAGDSFLALDNRLGLSPNDVIRIGDDPDDEYAVVSAIPNRSPAGVHPDAGNVLLATPLVRSHAVAATRVVRQNPPVPNPLLHPTVLALSVAPGAVQLLLSDGAGFAPPAPPAHGFVRVTASSQTRLFRIATLTPTAPALGAVVPQVVELSAPLDLAHSIGAPLVERRPLFDVEALDAGRWGNRLLVSVVDEVPGLVSRTPLRSMGLPNQIKLGSSAGVEAGSILELLDPVSSDPIGGLLKVGTVNRVTGDITLDGAGLDPGQQAAHVAAIGAGTNLGVRSREFQLSVRLRRQPDPANPSRDDTVLPNFELFRNLSMDPRHSRYVESIVGQIGGPIRLSDRRPEGESWYIRVRDRATTIAVQHSIRLGPETLSDVLPDGRIRAARHPLRHGDDSIAALKDATYIGADDPTPENRTGLQSLRNVEEISIVACPGRTRSQIQLALIEHCELMRYRFAVLDGPQPPGDTLTDVQNQRQQYDTKYAALYHPWLLIPDPFPASPVRIPDLAVAPAGHVVGVYARTDIERGVHKAPANEVIRGITGLQRVLNKEQQDILNPSPVNINVLRDFRPYNRGIRVYGGRCITSDPDWKYVNVRRLLIFIESSIDRGLQWVVFEPNAEPLWARVRRSISNFLTLVWRNGGLEGTKVEEAYFVKCDRTTMTQTDIDNGRLICVVGVAPVKPAEFVIIRIGLWTAHAED